ncbi:LOW QUALITY PROTEIN: hypothetical protein YC2023_004592 [Brassica napus]
MCSDFLLCCSPNISYKAKVHGLNVFQRLKGDFVFVLCMICLWFLPFALFVSRFHSHALSGWRGCISICFEISLMGMQSETPTPSHFQPGFLGTGTHMSTFPTFPCVPFLVP